jgi:hypothetical protein
VLRKARLNRNTALTLLSSIAVIGLCSFQYGDKYNLNSMRYSEVARLVSDLTKAEKLARQGNIEFLARKAVPGRPVQLRGELTDANCFLGSHEHAYDHAFCAKLCAAAGSPLVFLSDEGGQVYLVLPAQNAVTISDSVLDKVGIPGVTLTGKIVSSSNLTALAVEGVNK